MNDSPTTDSTKQPRRHSSWWRKLFVLNEVAIITMLLSVVAGTAAWWWIGDLCCHFRVPYIVVLTALTAIYLRRRQWRWLSAVIVVLAVNVSLVAPLYRPRVSFSATGESLRVMVANVHIGNHQPQPFLESVRDEQPDVLVVIEVDDRWLNDLSPLREDYPHVIHAIRDDGFAGFGPFGMAVMSRLPIESSEVLRLGTAELPVILVRILHEGRLWTFAGTHPYPPVSPRCAGARDSYLDDLGRVMSEVDGPKVVLGDLNITRWSPHFIRLLKEAELEDSTLGFGYQPTWPDWLPVRVLPIDHVLVSADVAVIDRRIGPSIASDHRSVIVDLATDN